MRSKVFQTLRDTFYSSLPLAVIIVICLLKTERARELTDVLYKEYHFDKPNTGIAFGITVEGLAF